MKACALDSPSMNLTVLFLPFKSHDKSLTLYYAEKDAAAAGVGRWKGLDVEHRCVEFRDLNCLPLDVVENIVRASLKLRRGPSH